MLLGCDVGPRDDQKVVAGELHVVGVSVSEDRPHYSDEAIEVSFDRLLLPSTVVRQSFVIRDAFDVPVDSPIVTYDPVLRVVRIDNPRLDQGDPAVRPWMLDNQPYTLTLGVPKPGEDTGGFRALDRATLETNSKRQWGFIARVRPVPPRPPTASNERFCGQVMPVFRAKCATCHGASRADMGLDLSSPISIQKTAIGRLARTTARGSSSTLPTSIAPGFGRDMAIIDPRSPGTSVLLYKVLMAAPAGEGATTPACGGTNFVPPLPVVPYFGGLDSNERDTLGAFITGMPMPFSLQGEGEGEGGGGGASSAGLSLTEQRVIAAWIADGAVTPPCAACSAP